MKKIICALFSTVLILSGLNVFAQSTDDCLDYTNLYSQNVKCYYGDFWNPMQSQGVQSGRHTVMTSGVDSYSGLSCVAPGETSSIRLGNSSTGAQAEAIEYTYTVDTNQYDLLILKYTAVMQDPNHSAAEQPRFTFKLLNSWGTEIDPICSSADFIAGNSTQGWHGSSVLWKDWTTVGFDVSAYHGQTIKIRLTTYDCSQYGHFGYAYFYLGCAQRKLRIKACGQVSEATFTAPDGFNYSWYWGSNPNSPISSNQTVTVQTDSTDVLYCTVSYKENANCKFSLSSSVQTRYPLADFNWNVEKCFTAISFDNTSVVTPTWHGTPDSNAASCENSIWNFGNGQGTIDYVPDTIPYPGPGSYNVTLISSIPGLSGDCYDTITKVVTIPPYNPTLTGDTLICKENSGTFTASGSVDYIWSYQNLTTPSITVPDSGLYYVQVIDTAHACLDTLYIHLRYFDDFVVDLGPDTMVCSCGDGSVVPCHILDAYDPSRPDATYIWNTGATTSQIQTPNVGTYIVTVTNNHACSNSDTVNISFYPTWKPDLGPDSILCDLATMELDALTPGINGDTALYLWIDGSTNRKFTVYPNGGDYWVIVTDMCYAFSDTINIDYLQIPDLHIGNDTVLCYGDPLVLDAYTRAYTYYWEYDGSTNETFFPTETGAYTCTISGYCGSTSSTVNVEFKDCNIIVPNVYTPNGDGVNDYFEIDFYDGFEFDIFSFSVHIYDRWGKLMYHSLDPDFKWDGNESGSKASDGVYYWVITFSTQGGIYRELNGSVTRISSK